MSRRTFEAFALVVALLFCLTILAPLAHCQACVTNSQVTLTGSLRAANGLPSSNSIISLAPSPVAASISRPRRLAPPRPMAP